MTSLFSLEILRKKVLIISLTILFLLIGFYITSHFTFSVATHNSLQTTIMFTAEEESMTALEIIEQNCKGSIHQEFPEDFWNKTIKEIRKLAQGKGEIAKKAKKAWKLLSDKRFRKP